MGGAAKTLCSYEIYHRQLCGISKILVQITEITTQCFAEALFLFSSQKDRGRHTNRVTSLKTSLFAQREKNLTCLSNEEKPCLG